MRRRRWLAGLYVLLSALPVTAGAGLPVARFTAETPERADALTQQDFDAIVAEAGEVANRPRDSVFAALPAQWRTLDRARLLALLRMPEYARIPHGPRGVLLNQAATWDLLYFRRPSDAALLWERLWPRAESADPNAGPNQSPGIGYSPDPTWSAGAFAMSALFTCLPRSSWSTADPMVAALREPVAWQSGNHIGWKAIQLCVPHAVYTDGAGPDVARVEATVAVLKARFAGVLYADRCSRSGPDDCLLLFSALMSLDPYDADLPAILRWIEPEMRLAAPIVIPAVRTPPPGQDMSAEDLQTIRAPEDDALRRTIYLTHKLPLLLSRPDAWPPGELERTLEQATHLSVVLARLQSMQTFRQQKHDRHYSDPWQWVDERVENQVASHQSRLGADYARREGCLLMELNVQAGTSSFWGAYAAENVRLGRGDCQR